MSTENQTTEEVLKKIQQDRSRTNILKKYEQNALAYLVQRVPSYLSSDNLTLIGFVGSVLVFLAFVLGKYIHINWLLLGIIGLAINWLGDSLDGRVAWYRNKSRKWYGFSIDVTTDWLSTLLMGLGFIVYTEGVWDFIGFAFVVLYGWAMLTMLLRYKVLNTYAIDSGSFGPTEVRLAIAAVLLLEVLVPGSILFATSAACIGLLFVNIGDSIKLLQGADARDKAEKAEKLKNM